MEAIADWYQDHLGVSSQMATILARQDERAGIGLGQLGYLGREPFELPPQDTFAYLDVGELSDLAAKASARGKFANAAIIRSIIKEKTQKPDDS
jgi:hypothetical protein